MKTPKKAPRRKNAVGKSPSKPKGTSKPGSRRTNGYRKVDNEIVTFAGRALKSPITPGEEEEFSEDELGATATTVGVPGIRGDRSGMRKAEFVNKDGTRESVKSVKRKLAGISDGVDGRPVHSECTYEEVEPAALDLIADG